MGTRTRMALVALVALAAAVVVWLAAGSPVGAAAALAGALGAAALAGRPAPAGTAAPVDQAGRGALIAACLYVRDRLTSAALAQRLDQGLAEAGVTMLAPVGERFDPARHEAGGTTPAPDPALDGTVAVVEIPGYADRGTLLRAPVVTVYRNGSETRT